MGVSLKTEHHGVVQLSLTHPTLGWEGGTWFCMLWTPEPSDSRFFLGPRPLSQRLPN